MLLTLVTMDSRKTQMMSIQKQEKAQTRRRMLFKARTLPGARRENTIVRLPGWVDEAKNANTPHDTFSLFIFDDILNIILTHTNQKINDYLFNFTGKVHKWMRLKSLE
jgi:hypothetical protein